MTSQPIRASAGSAGDGYLTWTADGAGFTIEYRESVLREIGAAAAEGFAKIPRGGIEVGGLLLGQETETGIRIEASLPLEIEYRSGPSFELSVADEETLERLLHDASARSGLEVAGWWHSHTRSEIGLSDADLHLHERFFPGAAQVALVVRPRQLEPTRFGFMFRQSDGSMMTRPLEEFELPKRRRPSGAEHEPAPHTRPPLPVAQPFDTPVPAPAQPWAEAPAPRHRWWLYAVPVLLAALVLGVILFRKPGPEPVGIGLRLVPSGGFISVEWDRDSEAVRLSNGAELQIEDGGSLAHTTQLDKEYLSTGRVTYVPRSQEMRVRMRLLGAGQDRMEYTASLIAPKPLAIEKDEPEASTASQGPPGDPQTRNRAELPALILKPEPQQSQVRVARPLQLPPQRTAEIRGPEFAGAPPNVALTPSLEGPGVADRIVVPPPKPQPAAEAVPVRRVPTSGRAIWTGHLPPGNVLSFYGEFPSIGTITGQMPRRPARVAVYPADLGNDGIVVYTVNREGGAEPPSAANGWNRTVYRADAKRVNDLLILEAPVEENQWKTLRLQPRRRKLSVIVIDWQELPPRAGK